MPVISPPRRTGLLATAVAVALVTTLAGPATAAEAPISHVRVVAELSAADGQRPENITLEPDGSAVVTFAFSRQVARIDRAGQVDVLATLPAPPAGASTPVLASPFLGGIVRTHDGTLYFLYATGTADLTGLWRLRPGGAPERIAALPADSLPNGLALDRHGRLLYATDSVLGTVWRIPVGGGTPVRWATGPALEARGFLGANGVKVHNGAVWVSNLDQGTVLRLPVTHRGTAGPVEVRATGLVNIDDIAFTGSGNTLLAAINADNEVALVRSDGSHRVVLSGADGLRNPTSLAVRGSRVLVAGAAYFITDDPNLLTARIGHRP
ncbi:hypothetical protein AB0O01_01830 [Streptomyces sp. NPDC093252]|uniref:hypothetical protein n=1 Tax=Streptomyces sp. NPDC093252 TaxID=3154980 RepID=UPI003439580E